MTAADPGDTTRWRLDIGYDGTDFSGWAAQADRRTVQGVLEEWLPQVLRLSTPVSLVCAGRTDAGVHARGQVAHLDLPSHVVVDDGATLHRRLARVLPDDIIVGRVSLAPPGFDARFAAIWRRYVYRITDGVTGPDPLYRKQITAGRGKIDLEHLNAAAQDLVGLRDFAAFCKRRDGATTIRTLLDLHASRVSAGPMTGVVEVTVRADAFCHSMVRSLMGALVAVGSGRRDREWLRQVINSPVRHNEVTVMPAHGLTLEEVGYPSDEQLAARVAQARAVREVPR